MICAAVKLAGKLSPSDDTFCSRESFSSGVCRADEGSERLVIRRIVTMSTRGIVVFMWGFM